MACLLAGAPLVGAGLFLGSDTDLCVGFCPLLRSASRVRWLQREAVMSNHLVIALAAVAASNSNDAKAALVQAALAAGLGQTVIDGIIGSSDIKDFKGRPPDLSQICEALFNTIEALYIVRLLACIENNASPLQACFDAAFDDYCESYEDAVGPCGGGT